MPERLKNMVADYKINVIDIRDLMEDSKNEGIVQKRYLLNEPAVRNNYIHNRRWINKSRC